MENASKALLIAGAILLCILIIAIGMFIYNGAQSTITESMTTMSTQETDSFNNQFLSYEGKQSGSNIKAMIGRLIANANTYKDEPTRIPGVYFDQVTVNGNDTTKQADVPDAGNAASYINALGSIRNKVETKHEYWVEMNFQANGLIDYINVSYDLSDILVGTELQSRTSTGE